MGLDVYLYRCKDPKALTNYEKKQNDAHEDIYQALLSELKTKDLGLGFVDLGLAVLCGFNARLNLKARDRLVRDAE